MRKQIDLFMFMGQSNMAGRGISSQEWPETPPVLMPGAGYEFRAISDPTRLYPIVEPFGRRENNPQGISENLKTGSLATAFCNAYYETTGIAVVGVSASKGGSSIAQWQPGSALLMDAVGRLKRAEKYLCSSGYLIRHRFMLWCQGETDGDLGMTGIEYKTSFDCMFKEMKRYGIEICFMIQIGHYNGTGPQDYSEIMQAQEQIAAENKDVVMVSRSFAQMKERGLMKDEFHYFQAAYNIVGAEAGKNAGGYLKESV